MELHDRRPGFPDLTIREAVARDRAEWLRLRDALWPGSLAEHDAETRQHFEGRPAAAVVFVAEAGGRLVGFLELDYRTYAPGCSASPVPYIEGWYVEPALQRRGIGQALMRAAEAAARTAGHHEIASDALIDNAASLAAREAMGFEEVERIACFRKALARSEDPEAKQP